MSALRIILGWDAREDEAYQVARHSFYRRTSAPLHVSPLKVSDVRYAGLFRRPVERRDGRLWDVPSQAWAATEFATTRFLIPWLAPGGWVLFADCDVLALDDIKALFALAEPERALMVVKHDHQPTEMTKMDGQVQAAYARKNWSSVMLWNLDHPAHKRLTLDMVNEAPGRDLHRFCWLEDDEIGALPPRWNWLEGSSPLDRPASIVHYTRGGPWFEGYQDVAYAGAWLREREIMRSAGLQPWQAAAMARGA